MTKFQKITFWISIVAFTLFVGTIISFITEDFLGFSLFSYMPKVLPLILLAFYFLLPLIFWIWAPIQFLILTEKEKRKNYFLRILPSWISPFIIAVLFIFGGQFLNSSSCPPQSFFNIIIHSSGFKLFSTFLFLLSPSAIFIFLFFKIMKNKDENHLIKRWVVIMAVFIFIFTLFFNSLFIGLGSFGSLRARGRDARRIADIRTVQNALELYWTKFNKYPESNGTTSQERWSILEKELRNQMKKFENEGFNINQIPHDPCENQSNQSYDYGVSVNSENYVLKAVLEDKNHPALKGDIDETIFKITCEDPNYCVKF